MIAPLKLILIVAACVCFAFGAFFNWWWPNENRVNLLALGLLCWCATGLVA
jgi:hypothetical protein